ncbi:MAG: DUF2726 domain-containing protein [Burkholderiaceae bacterium]|nr:DUF2726 domain-containing protein [Burkholderiaceae bacterium]
MPPYLPWILAALALTASASLATWWWLSRRVRSGPPPLPVEWDLLPRPVFTADERRLYRQLREALPHHTILAKLPLVRFCQPADPEQVRYWYGILGSIQVQFAVCSTNGRVLAAIDLHYDRGGPPARATRIKQSVLGACRVRYLRCPADHLPSVTELQLLVPQSVSASRGPQPASADSAIPLPAAAAPAEARPLAGSSRRRERTTLWQDSLPFTDSFFMTADRRYDAAGQDDLQTDADPSPADIGFPAGLGAAASPQPT